MRNKLRIAALLLVVAIVGLWLLRGANRGWTKTSVFEIRRDPVTELDGYYEVKRFVPGVDFLCLGLALAAVVAGGSFFFHPNPHQ